MTTKIKPIPEGYHTLSAYLTVRGASDALEFYKKAFGAVELMRLNMPDGKIAHAEFKIGNSILMISDENPECGSTSPEALGGSPVTLHLYVADADATFSDAIQAGAKEKMPLENQFWGIAWAGWSILSVITGWSPRMWKMLIQVNFRAEWRLASRENRHEAYCIEPYIDN